MDVAGRGASPTSFFTETIFTRRISVAISPSPFIKAMHPKAAIRPEPTAITRILAANWVGQLKIHGHRAQIHIPANVAEPVIAYNRHGKKHKKALPQAVEKELRRIFSPDSGWNVIDTEWLKGEDKIYVFDFLKRDGELLRRLTFPDRWKSLPRDFISPFVSVLPLIRDLPGCLKALQSTDPNVEGLVFKSMGTPGFSDTSIVRCRKSKSA